MGVSPWMNATVGPSEARRAKEGASVDSAEGRKDITGVNPWRLHGSVRELWKHEGNKNLPPKLASKAKKRSYSDIITPAQSLVMQ